MFMRYYLVGKTSFLLVLCMVFLLGSTVSGQVIDSSGKKSEGVNKANTVKSSNAAEPDTNFTYEKYGEFLKKISDPSKYVVLPLDEFKNTYDSNKIVIGLRHDVDVNLIHALAFSDTEYNLGFRSTYFILHTAPYYLLNATNMAVHNDNIIPLLKKLQDERHFEIGWHNDLVTLQLIYGINPVDFLKNELNWLRSNGIRVTGTASHGSPYCHTYGYLNYYFFRECSAVPVMPYANIDTVTMGSERIKIIKGNLSDFGLNYEAYFLKYNKAFSDASVKDGIRWNISMLDLNNLTKGDRVVILLHPIHWHKASIKAKIESFSIHGQKASYVDSLNSTVTVIMPHGINLENLRPSFTLSPGAYAKVSGSMVRSGLSSGDFSVPVIYTVFAENRAIQKNWTVIVRNDMVLDIPNKEPAEDSMEIYPNPAEAFINISIKGAETPQKIEIYNFNGRKVYRETLSQTGDFTKHTDLSFLKPGVYVVRNATTGKKVLLILK